MADLPLKALTDRLRQQEPAAEQLRIRRALDKHGRRIYQLVGVLPDGKRVARKLKATNEFEALDAAVELTRELMAKGAYQGRVVPVGAVARHEMVAMKELEQRQLRPATVAHKADHLRRATDWFTERNLPITQATLLACVEDVELHSRAHRARIEAVQALARAAGIQLEIPKRLRYKDPLPKRRETVSDDEILRFLRNDLEELPQAWRYLYRVVGCTGIRANGVFSLQIPDCSVRPGTVLHYWDSKRNRPAKTTPTLDVWEEFNLSAWPSYSNSLGESFERWKECRMPPDRAADDLTLIRANSTIQEATAALRRVLGTEKARRLSFRQLRHAAGSRMLLAGMDPLHVGELMSTSVAQLETTYSGMFRSRAAEAAGALFTAK